MVFIAKNSLDYPEIDAFFLKSFDEFNNYFNLNWQYSKPMLFFIETRKDMDEIENRKTEDWCIGTTKGAEIFVFSPESVEKETCHRYEKEYYLSIIKHELVHSFTTLSKKCAYLPRWFWEGLAIYLSNQLKYIKKVAEFHEFLDCYNGITKKDYYESGFAIEILEKKFGKEKLLEILKLKNINNKEEFDEGFEKIYRFKPNYEFFNNALKE